MTDFRQNTSEAWEACPPGQLQDLVSSMRRDRHRRTVRRAVVASGVAVLVALSTWMAVSQGVQRPEPAGHGPYIAGVCCDDVRREMPDLIAMRLEPARAAQLKEHIDQCPDCRQVKRQMEGKVPMSFDRRHLHRDQLAMDMNGRR